ncbi:hypothetical protein QIH33_21010, partial [Klebsiella pneumoniae]|nr:hypothetical protein [Klebsiella pneumoniae]
NPASYRVVRTKSYLFNKAVLSEKGQQILASQADIPSIRRDIAGKNDIDGMTALLGKALKPIPVNETLLDYLQPKKRLQFIKQWRSAAAK